ncbi:MAG: hypothetical protein MHPSP_003693, partial [Paramarteilia canceri]
HILTDSSQIISIIESNRVNDSKTFEEIVDMYPTVTEEDMKNKTIYSHPHKYNVLRNGTQPKEQQNEL